MIINYFSVKVISEYPNARSGLDFDKESGLVNIFKLNEIET
jgi:hypothetical protein